MSLDTKLKMAKSQAQVNQKVIDEINGLEDGTKVFTLLQALVATLGETTLGETTITAENTDPLTVNRTGPAGGYILNVQKGGSSVASIDTEGWIVANTLYCQVANVQQLVGVPSFTTALRPTTDLKVGGHIFDTTLGKPIWVKSLSPTVWVDATGATV